MKVLIDQHGKAVQLIHVICFFWFVQNHRKGWTGSAAGLEKNPDRRELLLLEIILQNFFGLFRHVNHLNQSPFNDDRSTAALHHLYIRTEPSLLRNRLSPRPLSRD